MGIAVAVGALGAAVLPSAAGAAVTCSLDGAGEVDVQISADGDGAWISQEAIVDGGRILVDDRGDASAEFPCLNAGVPADETNTNRIVITEAPPADFGTDVRIRLDGGGFINTFEVGTLPDIEIHLDYAEGGGGDGLLLDGTSGDDVWALGGTGINFNAGLAGDSDIDIIYPAAGDASIESNQFAPQGGDDEVHGESFSGATETAMNLRVFGDAGEDLLIGGSGADNLTGNGHDDTLRGRGNSDTFFPGEGNDTIDGATASGLVPDALNYGFATAGVTLDLSLIPGAQSTGSGRTDTITGVFPLLYGSPYSDLLKGSSGDEQIRGQGGDDVVEGGAGADQLFGAIGEDLLRGGLGNDILIGDGGLVQGQPGDTVAYDGVPAAVSGVTVDLTVDQATGAHGTDDIVGLPNVIGSPFADTITGNAEANTLTGGGGPDNVSGLAGADTLLLRDGIGDIGDCGTDGDSAVIDAGGLDVLAGCEAVDDGTTPPAAAATAATAPTSSVDQCGPLRGKLKKAKKRLKAAKRADKPTKKKRKKVRKLKRELRALGC